MVLNCFCDVQSMYARGLQMQAEIDVNYSAKVTDVVACWRNWRKGKGAAARASMNVWRSESGVYFATSRDFLPARWGADFDWAVRVRKNWISIVLAAGCHDAAVISGFDININTWDGRCTSCLFTVARNSASILRCTPKGRIPTAPKRNLTVAYSSVVRGEACSGCWFCSVIWAISVYGCSGSPGSPGSCWLGFSCGNYGGIKPDSG
jgi:hypothetical protein